MNGTQKTIHEELKHLSEDVRTGRYGSGDDFDAAAFSDDFAEMRDRMCDATGYEI